MFKKFRFFLLGLFVFVSLKEFSQSKYVLGIFPTIDHTGLVNEKLKYNFYYFGAFPLIDLQSPENTDASQFLMLYLEQSITTLINPNWNFTGSYVFQKSNLSSSAPTDENRFYIQSSYSHRALSWQLKHRLRWDARWIKNPLTSEIPFSHRLRYFIGMERVLSQNKAALYLTLYEELFFNTVKGANPVFEENWAYVGIGKKLNDWHKLEAGLLYITWVSGLDSWFNQFYLQFTWISTFDWKQQKK